MCLIGAAIRLAGVPADAAAVRSGVVMFLFNAVLARAGGDQTG
jgi:hypothetical protein